ncbi:hypothetical protein Hanom_Chr09g00826421 [Helianthus anomalus]
MPSGIEFLFFFKSLDVITSANQSKVSLSLDGGLENEMDTIASAAPLTRSVYVLSMDPSSGSGSRTAGASKSISIVAILTTDSGKDGAAGEPSSSSRDKFKSI